MNLKETNHEKAIVIEIEGRLDTTNFGQFEQKIMGRINDGKINILVNCSKMDYVSSSGLRVFLMALKKLTSLNGRFALCGLQSNIREIFEISGFTSIFNIYEDCGEALKTF